MQIIKTAWLPLILGLGIAAVPLTMPAQTGSAPQSSQEQMGGQSGAAQNQMGGQEGSSPDKMGTESKSGNSGRRSGATSVDKRFMHDAAQGGMAEVELGRLAAERASSEEVKKFGQRMIDDHTKAGDQLKEVAGKQGVQLPATLSTKDKMTKERLAKLRGGQFDKAYMADMVKDHVKDVADFRQESKMGSNAEVKDFATQTLPILEDHLRQAKSIVPANKTMTSNQKSSQK